MKTPEVLNGVIEKENLFRELLGEINAKYNVFEEIRGQGLLLGAALNKDYEGRARDFLVASANEKLMCLVAGANVVRFAPSLIISEEEIRDGMARFERAVASVVNA